MRDDREYLRDIQEAIDRIEKHTKQGREVFQRDELVQNWVVHHLQIIGEATRRLSSALKERHAEVPWSRIVGMRNILVHDYFAIDVDVVWQVVEHEILSLKLKISAMLKELGE